jgi:hypothetical protein
MLFQASLLEENIKPRANLPPLLVHLCNRRREKLHYLGVSFGLTQELFRFWRKHNIYPFYVGQIPVMISNQTCHNRLTELSVSPSVVLIAIFFPRVLLLVSILVWC